MRPHIVGNWEKFSSTGRYLTDVLLYSVDILRRTNSLISE